MARATHLTIGTADRIRLDARRNGYDESHYDDEEGNEVRQEVQVSVTYLLDPGDTDLTLLAEEKAEEVRKAHEAAWNRIGALGTPAPGNNPICNGTPGCTCRRDRSEQNDESEDENDDPEDGLPGARVPADPPPTGSPARAWYLPGASRFSSRNGSPEKDPGPDHETCPKSDKEPVTDEEPATGPQRILIRSRAKKAGLNPYALERLLHEQFKVWKVERLTKAQAASLLDALERDLVERDLNEKGNGSTVSPLAAGGDYAA